MSAGTSVYYGGQGAQPLRMAGWANWKPGWTNEKHFSALYIFSALCAEFYQTNVAHPGVKPCRRPWHYVLTI